MVRIQSLGHHRRPGREPVVERADRCAAAGADRRGGHATGPLGEQQVAHGREDLLVGVGAASRHRVPSPGAGAPRVVGRARRRSRGGSRRPAAGAGPRTEPSPGAAAGRTTTRSAAAPRGRRRPPAPSPARPRSGRRAADARRAARSRSSGTAARGRSGATGRSWQGPVPCTTNWWWPSSPRGRPRNSKVTLFVPARGSRRGSGSGRARRGRPE